MTRQDPRQALINAAERLVAERGLDVPLREVATAAGQRNNSAVQYHFGTRAGLVEAVIRARMLGLESRRAALLAALDDGVEPTVTDLVRVLVVPMTELVAGGDTFYARFLEQARTHPALTTEAPLDDEAWSSTRAVMALLNRRLADLPVAVRRVRLRALATTMFALLADVERAGAGKGAEDQIVAMLVGLLTATD